MMNFLSDIAMFVLQAMTLVISLLILVAGCIALGRKPKPQLDITSLNKEALQIKYQMQKQIFGKITKVKHDKKNIKPHLYVLDFEGDIKASQVDSLRQEISAIIAVAKPHDAVLVRLTSPGGSVNGYGLAAAQLQRIRDQNLRLTVCIDKVAASGGYLMAAVAHQIIAAPFSIIGSIGVVAQLPNFHRWLKKNDIDVEVLTAGEYKRTLTIFGENTNKGRQKFQEDLELIHKNFRDYVFENREQLDMTAVATGEHWLATDALHLGLVDKLQTSDEYLAHQFDTFDIFKITVNVKKTLIAKLFAPAAQLLSLWG